MEKNRESMPLKVTEVILIDCNVFNDVYLQNLRVLYKFVSNKSFDQLLDILPIKIVF